MPDLWIDSVDKLDNALHYWRNHSFSEKYINLRDALASLDSEEKLVEAHSASAARWVVGVDVFIWPQNLTDLSAALRQQG